MRKCIVYKTALRDDVNYEGIFHGFFTQGTGEVGDSFDIEPVALVEKENGNVNAIEVRFFAFKKEDPLNVVLRQLPQLWGTYTAKKIPVS